MTKTSSQLKAPVLNTNFETSDVLSALIAGRDGVVPNKLNTSRDYIKSGKLKSKQFTNQNFFHRLLIHFLVR